MSIPTESAKVLESTWQVPMAQAQQLAVTLFTDGFSSVLWVLAGFFSSEVPARSGYCAGVL